MADLFPGVVAFDATNEKPESVGYTVLLSIVKLTTYVPELAEKLKVPSSVLAFIVCPTSMLLIGVSTDGGLCVLAPSNVICWVPAFTKGELPPTLAMFDHDDPVA